MPICSTDRMLTCYRLPLLMRGVSSLLAATTLVMGLPFDALAQESDLYSRLETANWGRAGSVTQYAYDDNGSLVSKSITGGGVPVVETYSYDLQINRAQSPRQGRRATAILRPTRSGGARSRIRRHSGN